MSNELVILEQQKAEMDVLVDTGNLSPAAMIKADEFYSMFQVKQAELELQKVASNQSGLLNLNDVAQSLGSNEEFTVSVKRQSLATKNSEVEINQSKGVPLVSVSLLLASVALVAALVS